MRKEEKPVKKSDTVHEPFVHITKRDDLPPFRALLIRLGAILLALIVCALIIYWLTGLNPLAVYKAMFDGSFSSKRKFWVLLQNTAMLLCIALAVTPAFRMRFWNLGAEGQVLVGGLATFFKIVKVLSRKDLPVYQGKSG